MVYDTLDEYTCRKAERADVPAILEILEPLVVDEEWHEDRNNREVRAVRQAIPYFVKNDAVDAIVVESSTGIVGVFTCAKDKIGNLANIGDIRSLALLLKIGLCDIQNKFQPAKFQVSNGKIRDIYERIRTKEGNACSIDALGNGTVSVEAKKEIERLYQAFK